MKKLHYNYRTSKSVTNNSRATKKTVEGSKYVFIYDDL